MFASTCTPNVFHTKKGLSRARMPLSHIVVGSGKHRDVHLYALALHVPCRRRLITLTCRCPPAVMPDRNVEPSNDRRGGCLAAGVRTQLEDETILSLPSPRLAPAVFLLQLLAALLYVRLIPQHLSARWRKRPLRKPPATSWWCKL